MTTPPPGPVVLQPGESLTVQPPSLTLSVADQPAYSGTGGLAPMTVSAAPPSPIQPDPLVLALQQDINNRGYQPALKTDGWYGPATDTAVRSGLSGDMTPPSPTPAPAPPQPTAWHGFGINENGDSANGFASFDQLAAALGRWPDWVRSFQTVGAHNLDPQERALRDRGVSMCHSLKLGGKPYADVTSGAFNSVINGWLDQVLVGTGRKDVCLNHEHNGPGSQSSGTNSQFAAALGRFNSLVRGHKLFDPDLHRVITIWIPWGFTRADWPLDPSTFQAYGADPYRWSSGSATKWEPLVNHATPVINAAAADKKPLCFPEFGVGHINGHGADRAKVVSDFLAYAKANADYACYFNGSATNGDMPLKRDPEAWDAYRSFGLTVAPGT